MLLIYVRWNAKCFAERNWTHVNARVHRSWSPRWLNYVQRHLTFQHNYCGFFPSHTKTCISPLILGRKHQTTLRFSGYSRLVDQQCGTLSCHPSGTKNLEVAPRSLENLWILDLLPITIILTVFVFNIINWRGENKVQWNPLKFNAKMFLYE
jgi:hypothetical protein